MPLSRRYNPEHPPGESCSFGLDLSFILPVGVSITSGSIDILTNTATPTDASSDWTIGPVNVRGRAIYANLSGGVAGTDYQLKWRALDPAGKPWPPPTAGGDMTILGALSTVALQFGSGQFSNLAGNLFSATKACVDNAALGFGSIAGVPIATVADLTALDAALRASTVWTFNGRRGDVRLWIDDIRCAGGAPIASPMFLGSPRAGTPPPTSNSSRLATTAFVVNALAGLTLYAAPPPTPAFRGAPAAPTAGAGTSDGQLATTAFVMNAVEDSTTGVASFH